MLIKNKLNVIRQEINIKKYIALHLVVHKMKNILFNTEISSVIN